MKLLILLSVIGAAVSRPSIGHHVTYANDGLSYSYSYQTPLIHNVVPAARYVHTVPAPVVVGPSVRYSYQNVAPATVHLAAPILAKTIQPSHIQISADGFVVDTAEVANARAEHLATYAKEASRVGVSAEDEYESNSEPIVVPENDSVEIKAFEPANIQVSEDGHVLDTPEVAQAKAEHLATFEAEKSRSGYEIYNGANVYAYNLVQPIHATQYHIAAPVVAAKAYEIADIKLSADGHVLDTPEVAQAKAEHLAQFASDAARAAAAGGDEESNEGQEYAEEIEAAPVPAPAPEVALKFDDPPANIQVSSDGFILDTPEVAEAKALHLQELAKAGPYDESQENSGAAVVTYSAPSYVAYQAPAYATQTRWAGPAADIKVSHDGFVQDTVEVAQAKAAHLQELAKAGPYEESQENSGAVVVAYNSPSYVAYQAPAVAYATQTRWAGPAADIKVSHDGFVQDTVEVAQAKAAHLQELAKAGSYEESQENSGAVVLAYNAPSYVAYQAPAVSYATQTRWAGPAADIKISHDGFVQDTVEVAQAKAAHLQEVAKASSESESASDEGESVVTYNAPSYVAYQAPAVAYVAQPKWTGPAADIRIGNDGFVQDTAEVAQAKAAHFQEVAKAGVQSESESNEGAYVAYTSPAVAYVAQSKWTGPLADIKISHDGFVQDTAEVAQAKAEHLATRASIMANSDVRYASGQYLAETSEVAAARAAHLAEHAKESAIQESIAKSAKTYNYGQLVYSAPVFRTVVPQSYAYSYHPVAYRYLGFRYAPAAHVAFTPDGKYLADTPEVTAEKIKHFEAHAKLVKGW